MTRPSTTFVEPDAAPFDPAFVKIPKEELKEYVPYIVKYIGCALARVYDLPHTAVLYLRAAAMRIEGYKPADPSDARVLTGLMTDIEAHTESVPDEVKGRYVTLALEMIGMCVRDFAMVMQQGYREDNEAKRGGVAFGLRKAALHIEGKRCIAAPNVVS